MPKNLSGITQNLIVLAVAALLSTPFAIAQILNKAELKALVGTANTSKDRERIAVHYDAKASAFDEEAKEHDELAAKDTANPDGHNQKHPMSGLTAGHCKLFAIKAREAALAARQIAADHRQMAMSAK